jgi:hypothetical protein
MAYPAQNAAGIETILWAGTNSPPCGRSWKPSRNRRMCAGRFTWMPSWISWPKRCTWCDEVSSEELKRLLGAEGYRQLPHEDLIRKLDEAAEQFRIVVLKTRMTIPYTTVFVQLDCGYWSDDAEKRLREAIGSRPR